MADKSSTVSRLGLLALALLPVFIGVSWPELVAERPVMAALLGLGWEATVAVLAFGGSIGRKLSDRWSERVANGIDGMARRALGGGGFAKGYRRYVLRSSRYIDQKGLKNAGFFTPDLDDVFVDVALTPRAPHQVSADILNKFADTPGERQSLSELLDRPDPAVLAVLGAPGSGKTTLLRHTAREVCRVRKGRRRLPILLFLRDHAESIVTAPDSSLPQILRETLKQRGLTEPPGWFHRRLEKGGCVVLLDGLDEVARPEDRRGVVEWVERQIARYPENHFVLTSRPHGYRTAPVEGAVVLQTQRLTQAQVNRFVHQWYLAIEQGTTRNRHSAELHERAAETANDLLNRLSGHPELHELTVNPLLLTMITNVHRYRGALPGSRAELYGEVCEVMLWRRQEAKKLPTDLTSGQREVVLREVAHTMMLRRVRDLAREEILEAIKPGLVRVSRELEPEVFLADLLVSGLVIERENEEYAFAHHTFQEYLAAMYLREKGLPADLDRMVGEEWWRETILLYTARADADPIVRACLEAGHAPALELAFECAEQPRELAPELRDRLDSVLAGALDDNPDSERRRLAVGVLAVRQLRESVCLLNDVHICVHPVTRELYSQFQELAEDGEHHRPDAPEHTEDGPEAVLGVRGSDALAFARWVNSILDGQRGYRLPSWPEMSDHFPCSRHPISGAVWVRAEDGCLELWSPDGASRTWLNGMTLAFSVYTDLCDSRNLLRGLLLVRAIVVLRALSRVLIRDPGLTHALDLAITHARDLVLGYDSARDLARSLTLTFDLTNARDLAYIDDLARDLALAVARARDLAHAHDPAHDLTHTLTLNQKLNLIRARVREVAHDLDLAQELDFARARDYSYTLDNLLDTVLESNTTDPDPQHFITTFYLAFIRVSGIGESDLHFSVDSFDTLTETVPAAVATLLQILDTLDSPSPYFWVARIARYLEEVAVPILTRRERLTPETATSIRLTALSLAAEADAVTGDAKLGDDFRQIAAGVTLLQRRLSGEEPATETIMLALD